MSDPKIVVCIPTCARPASLDALLRHLCEVDTSALGASEVELVVVDNAPNGDVEALCQRRARDLPFPIEAVREPRRGVASARNRAVAEALRRKADLLAFIDDDDLPEPGWLGELVSVQRERGVDLVFGGWTTVHDERTPAWLQHTKLARRGGPNAVRLRSGVAFPQSVSTCNVLVSRALLERLSSLGPVFAPEFRRAGGEDEDFFIRAIRAGARFAVAEASIVRKECDESRISFTAALGRSLHWGRASAYVVAKHAGRSAARQKRAKALWRLVGGVPLLVAYAGSRDRLMAQLYLLSNRLGMLLPYPSGDASGGESTPAPPERTEPATR